MDCKCSRKDCFRKLSKHGVLVDEFLGQFYEMAKGDQDDFVFQLHFIASQVSIS